MGFASLPAEKQKELTQAALNRPPAPRLAGLGSRHTSPVRDDAQQEEVKCASARCENFVVSTTTRRANTCCSCRRQFCFRCLTTCAKCAETDCVNCMANHDVGCIAMSMPFWRPRVGAPPEVMLTASKITMKPYEGGTSAGIEVDDEFIMTMEEFQLSFRSAFMCASPTAMRAFQELAQPSPNFLREHVRKVIEYMNLEKGSKVAPGANSEAPEQERSDAGEAGPASAAAVPELGNKAEEADAAA